MKNILLLLFLGLAACIRAMAQNEQYFNTPVILNLVNTADSCYKNNGSTCDLQYKQAAQLAEKSQKDDWGLIIHKLSMYYFKTNQMDSVWKYVNLGLEQTKDDNSKEAFLNLKSQLLYNEGYSDSAIKIMIDLANLLEERNKTDKLAYTLANIGIALYAQEDYKKSMDYLNKSYRILESINDSVMITVLSGNISDGYYELKEDSLAKVWSFKTLNLKNTVKADEGFFLAYLTLSKLHKNSSLDSALYYAQNALDVSNKINNKEFIGNANTQFAYILNSYNRSKEAQVYVEKAIQNFRNAPYVPGLAKVLKLAGDISFKNGLHAQSVKYYQEYIQLNDSIKSEKNFKTISELTTQYETEKKERQLAEQQLLIQKKNAQIRNWLIAGGLLLLGAVFFIIQNKRNQQRKIKIIQQENENAVLKAMMNGEEQERNRISKDLHDGVAAMLGAAKMSLQSIPYLAEEKKSTHLEKVSHLIDNTHNEVRRIAHDLLPITLEKEGLIVAVHQFAANLNQMGLLELQIDNQLSSNFNLPKRTELMLYRIIQELINNIIKHSQANKAKISFAEIGNKITINIEDNGIGFDDKKENQGLHSIKERLKALGGTFNIKGEKNIGTKVSLVLG